MTIKRLYHQHICSLLSIVLFSIVFCTLGLPFTQWGFKSDDWGNIYHCIIRQWSDFFRFFTEGNIEKFCLPCNVMPPDQAFFQGLYRPMSFIYYYLQYSIFGRAPYGFLLVTAFFHACNTVLFFNLLRLKVTISTAFLAAAYFGFHPSLWIWFGWTSAQTYFIELWVFFIIMYALLAYLRTQNFIFYFLGCVLYMLNLLLKEQTIFLPLWLVGAFYIYGKNFWQALKLSVGFWIITGCYLWWRLQLFPLTAQTGTLTFQPNWHSFITRFSSRFYDAISYLNEFLGFSWLPLQHQLIKGTLIITMLALLSLLVVKNHHKKYVLFLLCSIPLFSWPAIIMHFQPRYIYLALPLMIAAVALLIGSAHQWLKIALGILIGWNALFLVHHLAHREKILHMITVAFSDIVADPATAGKSLCFVDIPSCWFDQGTTQAVWLLRHDAHKPVFQVAGTKISSSLAREKPLFIGWNTSSRKFMVLAHDKT
ncbi:MAG: hypothetical protein WC365_02010 [Candidatus Babeliales bacterium]|jgi:hypothetical protein